ncbi:hypothetical protein V2J09_007809 [Rumex salicifolius]
MADQQTLTCVEILLAIILPPLGVFLKYECRIEFWICVLLTLFGWLPGIIYAIWVLTKWISISWNYDCVVGSVNGVDNTSKTMRINRDICFVLALDSAFVLGFT